LASSSRLIPDRPGRSRCLAISYSSARLLGAAVRGLDAAAVLGAAAGLGAVAPVRDEAAPGPGAAAAVFAAARVLGAAAAPGAAAVLGAVAGVGDEAARLLGAAAAVLAAVAPARVRRTTAAPC